MRSISIYSVRMRENADQNNSEYGHFSRSVYIYCPLETARKIKFSIKDFSSKYDQIRRKLRIWSHILEKSLMENFIFCAVRVSEGSITVFMVTLTKCWWIIYIFVNGEKKSFRIYKGTRIYHFVKATPVNIIHSRMF